jgi:hypothetical protein
LGLQGNGYNQWQKSEKSGTILIALNPVAFPIYGWNVEVHEAAPNDKLFFSKSYPSAINPDVVDIEGCSCEIEGANVTIKEGLPEDKKMVMLTQKEH